VGRGQTVGLRRDDSERRAVRGTRGGSKEREAARLTCLEICAGGGGQALGLEQAGFEPVALVDIDPCACATLRLNRPLWPVAEADVRKFSARPFRGVDLLAAGVPCPPFSVAGKRLGVNDDRDLFPEAVRLVRECRPRAVMLENVRGFLDPVFDSYRREVTRQIEKEGYRAEWRLLNACDFGVPQLRPRAVMVALRPEAWRFFSWPEPQGAPPGVGQTLLEEMASGGWEGARTWAEKCWNAIAPTIVGGSTRHGGPDLGPTRARRAWAQLGVDGSRIADSPPPPGFRGMPQLTVRMAALLQGFPPEWRFAGTKTQAYRQVGNAFPPPVARAVAAAIRRALESAEERARGSRGRCA